MKNICVFFTILGGKKLKGFLDILLRLGQLRHQIFMSQSHTTVAGGRFQYLIDLSTLILSASCGPLIF